MKTDKCRRRDPFYSDDYGESYEEPFDPPVTLKSHPFRTFLHYTDPTAHQERTVFGAAKKGLFYNYSDRLYGDEWRRGWDAAKADGLSLNTAAFFEVVLNHYHGCTDVDLQHVILGCNRSTGYSCLIFGYTYTEPPAAANP